MKRRWSWLVLVFLLASVARAAPTPELVSAADSPSGEEEQRLAPFLQICDSGGEGSRSCETRWTVNVGGWGWQSGCGISCADGYYACCVNPSVSRNATCGCVADPPHVAPIPYSPEQPGL